MRVKIGSPGVGVDIVDVDGGKGEGEVDDEEQEEENDDIVSHVSDADDDGPQSTPHEGALEWPQNEKDEIKLEFWEQYL